MIKLAVTVFPFFLREQKHFVDLGLIGSVPAANYSLVLLANETHLFKKFTTVLVLNAFALHSDGYFS